MRIIYIPCNVIGWSVSTENNLLSSRLQHPRGARYEGRRSNAQSCVYVTFCHCNSALNELNWMHKEVSNSLGLLKPFTPTALHVVHYNGASCVGAGRALCMAA